jgi:hypothetical protein
LRKEPLFVLPGGSFSDLFKDKLANVGRILSLDTASDNVSEETYVIGGAGGTGERPLESFRELIEDRGFLNQILNDVTRRNPDVKLSPVVIPTGVEKPSGSLSISCALAPILKNHPYFCDRLLLFFIITQKSKANSLREQYLTFHGLTFLHNFGPVILFDNDYRASFQEGNSNPYATQNEEIERILIDLFCNKRSTTGPKLKSRIWDSLSLDEIGVEKPKDKLEKEVTGKLLNHEKDLPTYVVDPHNKWGLASTYHPLEKPINGREIIGRCLSNISSPVSLPLVAAKEIGIILGLHNVPHFKDIVSATQRCFSSKSMVREVTINPEIHGPRGVFFLALSIPWYNLDTLIRLKNGAVAYAKERAEQEIPVLIEEKVRDSLFDNQPKRLEGKVKDLKNKVDNIFMEDYFEREEKIREKLVNGINIDEKLPYHPNENNSLSSEFFKETGQPNPFWSILVSILEES